MRWFRSNVRFGSRLALFALALQIVLTFGHVHLSGLGSALSWSAASATASKSAASLPNSSSPVQKPGGAADFDCPVCALIQLASTSAPAVAPALPVPAAFNRLRLEAPEQLRRAVSLYFSFQARAPPLV